jgi:esterase/lipase superfamily enzyme
MVESCLPFLDEGRIVLFTADSVDRQSWLHERAHPADRARRHNDYDRYVVEELIPFIRHRFPDKPRFLATGCSMGAFHAANFFFRHPDIFDTVIALSGLYKMSDFIGDYCDDSVYFNTPLYYLPGLSDPWHMDQYRRSQIVVCVGRGAWENECLRDTRELEAILEAKGIPAWVDFWGEDVNHDWPWWRRMMPYFLSRITL